MSATVARVPGPPAAMVRNETSPVPPATSSRANVSLGFRRIDRGDQRVLPGAVQPGRHQVVHQVVALRHLVEDVVDQRLLLAERHLAKAEMGVVAHAGDHSARGIRALHNPCPEVNHARASRSRNRAPRPAAGDGRRALRAGRDAPAGPALSVSAEFRQAARGRRPSTGLGRRAKYCWRICRPARCC